MNESENESANVEVVSTEDLPIILDQVLGEFLGVALKQYIRKDMRRSLMVIYQMFATLESQVKEFDLEEFLATLTKINDEANRFATMHEANKNERH